jgi:hypothetical protein
MVSPESRGDVLTRGGNAKSLDAGVTRLIADNDAGQKDLLLLLTKEQEAVLVSLGFVE